MNRRELLWKSAMRGGIGGAAGGFFLLELYYVFTPYICDPYGSYGEPTVPALLRLLVFLLFNGFAALLNTLFGFPPIAMVCMLLGFCFGFLDGILIGASLSRYGRPREIARSDGWLVCTANAITSVFVALILFDSMGTNRAIEFGILQSRKFQLGFASGVVIPALMVGLYAFFLAARLLRWHEHIAVQTELTQTGEK